MPRRLPEPSPVITVYLVLNDYRTGLACAEAAADREIVIRNFLRNLSAFLLRLRRIAQGSRRESPRKL
jgi:hypothetical protein